VIVARKQESPLPPKEATDWGMRIKNRGTNGVFRPRWFKVVCTGDGQTREKKKEKKRPRGSKTEARASSSLAPYAYHSHSYPETGGNKKRKEKKKPKKKKIKQVSRAMGGDLPPVLPRAKTQRKGPNSWREANWGGREGRKEGREKMLGNNGQTTQIIFACYE